MNLFDKCFEKLKSQSQEIVGSNPQMFDNQKERFFEWTKNEVNATGM